MLAGVMFRPISFKTLLGLEAQYQYGPYCTWKYGRNPIFTQVMGVPFRLMIKSGRGFVSCLLILSASFAKRFHNATTQFFTPKAMTMASAGAIRGKESPDGGVQWHLG